jgi:hypothetical protein
MRSIRKSGITALTAAIALSIGAIPAAFTASSILADGGGTTLLTPASTSVGTLTLATTPEIGRLTYGGMSQEFTSGLHCEVQPSPGGDDLLDISGSVQSGSTAEAGFKGGQIGVFEYQDANSSQCFRVDEGSFTTHEVLTLALGADLTSSFNTRATSATLKFLKQQSGDLTVTARFYSGTGEVRGTGQTVKSPKSQKSGSIFQMNVLEGAGFDRVTLEASGGSFSLVGPSTFALISDADALFCNPTNPNIPAGGSSSYTEGVTTVNYLGNADGSNSCFGVQLTSGGQEYQWLKPLTVSPDAQFTFIQHWSQPTPDSPDYSLNKAYINFELQFPAEDPEADPIPSEDHEMRFCPDVLYNTDGSLGLVTDTAKLKTLTDMEPDVAGVPGSIGTQFACIDKYARTTSITNGVNGLKVTDKIFLIGDAKFSM